MCRPGTSRSLAESATEEDTVGLAGFVRMAGLADAVCLTGPMRFEGFLCLAVLRKVRCV